METPSAKEILESQEEYHNQNKDKRTIHVEPWVAAHISDIWQGMKYQIINTLLIKCLNPKQRSQSCAAFVRNHS